MSVGHTDHWYHGRVAVKRIIVWFATGMVLLGGLAVYFVHRPSTSTIPSRDRVHQTVPQYLALVRWERLRLSDGRVVARRIAPTYILAPHKSGPLRVEDSVELQITPDGVCSGPLEGEEDIKAAISRLRLRGVHLCRWNASQTVWEAASPVSD